MSETDRDRDRDEDAGSESPLQRLRRRASEVLEGEAMRDALETTKEMASRGGHAVASLYDGVKKTVTQEEAWEQTERSVAALTDVVRVQHAMILDLLNRVARLESAARHPADRSET